MSAHRLSRNLLALILLGLVVLGGCGRSGPELYGVTGTVTRGGQPVPYTVINFTPVDGGRPSIAITQPNGSFKALCTRDLDGVLPGRHKVTFELNLPTDQAKPHPEMKAILAKYGRMGSDPLFIEFTEDPTVLDLKLD